MSLEDPVSASLGASLGATLRTPSSDPQAATLEQLPNSSAYVPGNLLGRGGMGEVRLCRDPRLGRDIALKTATTRNSEELERFVREAQIQGQLQHPSIVPVHELGVGTDGAPFFTMKRIKGHTLQEVIRQLRTREPDAPTRFNRHRLLSAFLNVCQAVEFAHTNGWIHRDIKPANIMLGDFGEVYVLDWGLARRVDKAEPAAAPFEDLKLSPVGATTPGTLLGTPGYMAPEQVLGMPADIRSDVYALGAVLFEVLTHQMLVTGGSAMELLVSTRTGADARARTRAPEREVSPELEAICLKATQRDAAARFSSVRELHDAVERVLSGERNLELRSDLAKGHADRAREAAARGGNELELRRTALKEVGQALALDPTHADALATLVKLMTNAPEVLPPEATAELEGNRSSQVKSAGRAGALAFLVYMVDLPLMILMGVRSWPMLGLSFAMIGATAAVSAWQGYVKQRPVSSTALPALFMSNLAISCSALLTGPFMVVPAMAAANTVAFASILDKKYRPLIISLGMATVIVPILFNVFGLMEEYRFVPLAEGGQGLLLLPVAVGLPTAGTIIYLACAGAGTVWVSALMVGFVRDKFDVLERHRSVQSWNLKQLIPPEAIVPPPDPVGSCGFPIGHA